MDIATVKDTGLDDLTDRINDAIERRDHSKEDWVAATIDLCRHLHDARARFKDNKSFGAWFDASGINLNEQDRSAAIAMGEKIEIARQVLGTTERRSLQYIRSKEFNPLAYVSKRPKPTNTAKPKTTPELEKALHAYDRRKQAGEDLTYEAIQEEAGVSSTPVRRAIAQRQAEEQIAREDSTDLKPSAKEKLEAAIRRQAKQLELEMETRVINETKKRVEEWYIPDYMKLLRKVEQLLQWRQGGGVMSRAEYRKIMRCIHPDTGAHVSDEARNEAFRLFIQYEAKLVADNEQADLKRISTLPKTTEELLARRRKK